MKRISKNHIIMSIIASLYLLISCSNDTADPAPEEMDKPVETEVKDPSDNTSSSEIEEKQKDVEKSNEETSTDDKQVDEEEQSNENDSSNKETDSNKDDQFDIGKTPEIVMENDAFKIFQPAPDSEVSGDFVVSGLARVFEGTIIYEFEDGHFILDEGFTTASEGAPGWGKFEITIKLDEVTNYSGRVILSEESAKDGSRMNELQIPVKVVE